MRNEISVDINSNSAKNCWPDKVSLPNENKTFSNEATFSKDEAHTIPVIFNTKFS